MKGRGLLWVIGAGAFAIAAATEGCGASDGESVPPAAGDSGVQADAHSDVVNDLSPGQDALLDSIADTTQGDGPVVPSEHPRILFNAQVKATLKDALATSQKPATRFRDMVDGQLGGADYYAFDAWHAAVMYQVSGDAKYADYAIAMIDAEVKAEEALIANGEKAEVSADSYLYVGERIGSLAQTYDWCFDRLTQDQKQRWLAYADQAVWNVWHPAEAVWAGKSFPWSGWSIDNPSNNYYYSFLRATMMLGLAAKGELPSADGWLTRFRSDKLQSQLVPTFTADLVGGGSREGTGYGVSMARLFELYYVWEQSTGERIADLTPHTKASLVYMMHETVPTLDRVAPIGDHARDSTAALFDYHRNYALVPVKLYSGSHEAQVGQWWLSHISVPEMSSAFMFVNDFLFADSATTPAPLSELTPALHAKGTGHIFLRSSWETDATWVNFICGPYTESHAHRDQGSFLLYSKEWLAFDENILTHSGIRQEQELHNLVRLSSGGTTIEMHEGAPASQLLALQRHAQFDHAACDMTPMFDGDANVSTLQRELVFLKPDVVVIFDRLAGASLQASWQLNTPLAPQVISGGAVQIAGTQGTLKVVPILPANLTPVLVDWASTDDDTSGGTRVDYVQTGSGQFLIVLAANNALASSIPSDSGTDRGVDLTLADGRHATVRLHAAQPGGSLKLTDAQSQTQYDGALGGTVEDIPVFAK
jgi:hypothetical protein